MMLMKRVWLELSYYLSSHLQLMKQANPDKGCLNLSRDKELWQWEVALSSNGAPALVGGFRSCQRADFDLAGERRRSELARSRVRQGEDRMRQSDSRVRQARG